MKWKFLGALLVPLLAVMGLAAPASAHTASLSGQPVCNDGGTAWAVNVSVNISNTPYEHPAEVKAMMTTAGQLNQGDGLGVMAGGQVVLNAWYEHRNNWPGVQTRRGNWSDTFAIVNIPSSVSSVTTEMQIDWKNYRAEDQRKTFYRPQGCKPPTDVCPGIDGNQPQGTQCEALPPEVENRSHWEYGDCKNPVDYLIHERRSREQVWNPQTNTWEWGEWTPWKVRSGQSFPKSGLHCETPPPPKPPTPPIKHARVKVVVKDLCRCKHDSVRVRGTHIAFKSIRQNKNTFVVRLVAQNGYLLPVNFKRPGGAYAKHVKYVIHTTNKPCPCQVKHTCKPKPKPRPKPPCGCRP